MNVIEHEKAERIAVKYIRRAQNEGLAVGAIWGIAVGLLLASALF